MPEQSENSVATNSLPLNDRTIVVTRARAQAAEFVERLEGLGARVILCPAIEITEPESFEPLDIAIDHLYRYDWLIFTSVNGVEYFLRRFHALDREVSELDELRVCAIGDATADRLRDAAIHVDLVPLEFKAEGAFTALVEYLGGQERIAGLNFLMPRAAVARDYLPRALEAAGARVDVVPAYRTVRPDSTGRRYLEALLAGGGVDCVTFTSASTVTNFAQLFDTHDLRDLLAGVAVACIGEITAQAAVDHGLTVQIRSAESTTAALSVALAHHFSKPS